MNRIYPSIKQFIIEKRLEYLIAACVFICIGFTIYSNSLHSPFVFDDDVLINNPALKGELDFAQINQPRYVAFLTFFLNYRLHKYHTFGYHLFNTIIHITNAFLVFLIFKKICSIHSGKAYHNEKFFLPFFTALIFLVHPIQTQAITYIIQRFASLAALFALISIFYYLKFKLATIYYSRYSFLIISLIAALLAYKTKENTATLPLIILSIELIFFKENKLAFRAKFLPVLLYFIVLIVIPISYINSHIKSAKVVIGDQKTIQEVPVMPRNSIFPSMQLQLEKQSSWSTPVIPRTQYLRTEFRVIISYFRLLLIPINQSVDYYYPLSKSLFEIDTFLSFCTIIALILLSLIILKKYPIISFGILWFFIFNLMESSIIPIPDVIFEYRIYLPSIGFIAAFVNLIMILAEKLNWKYYKWTFVPIIIFLSFLTFERNKVWKDELTLFKDATSKYPQRTRNHFNLGKAYSNKGMIDDAIREFETYMPYDDKSPKHHFNLGYCYAKKGWMDKAIREYNIAISLAPYQIKPYSHLAMIYLQQNNVALALELLKKAYLMDNSNPEVNTTLGIILCVMNDSQNAIRYFEQVIKSDPDFPDAYYNLGICLFNQNNYEESRKNFIKAVTLSSEFVESYFFIAVSYDKQGNLKGASHFYHEFLKKSSRRHPYFSSVELRLKEIN